MNAAQEVGHREPRGLAAQGVLDRVLLRALHDARDERAGDQVRQIDALMLAADQRRQEQGGRLITRVQRVDGRDAIIPATASFIPPNRAISAAWIGTCGVKYFEKMSIAPARSGRSTRMRTSRRPGRKTAGSIMSARLDAPMITTLSKDSTPSISARSCGTIIVSTSEDTPVPRVRNSASISSKKMTTGVSPAARVPSAARRAESGARSRRRTC